MAEKIVFDSFTKHLALYAKYHYVRTTFLSDIRTIISRIADLEPKHVDMRDIHSIMTNVLDKCLEIEPSSLRKIFLADLFHGSGTILTAEEYWKKILSFLGNLQVKNRPDGIEIELGEADPNILPIAKKERATIH